MAVCYSCGATDKEKDTWRFCSYRKKFVCKLCEELCENYSKKLLPNGTHCRRTYFTAAMYLVSPEVIAENRSKYDNMTTLELVTQIDTMRRRYLKCEDKEIRRSYQIRLAAASTVLEERKGIE